MLSRHNLHAYQRKAVDFILSERRCMLALEMGLGKSVSTLTAISDMLDGFTANKVLVIAPLRVANSVWAQETRLWAHLNHLRVSVCTGAEKARRSALSVDADVYVINRENVPWLVQNYASAWPFDVVVIDGLFREQMVTIALDYVREDGMIIVDNADGYGMGSAFANTGLLRVNFYGYAPGVYLPHCTSVYFRPGCRWFAGSEPIVKIALADHADCYPADVSG